MNHISLGLDAVTQHRKVCGNDYMKKKMSQQLCKAGVVTNTGKKLSLLSCTQYSSQLLPYSSYMYNCMYVCSDWYLCFEVSGELGDSGGMVQDLLVESTNQRQESSLQQLTTSDSKTILP